MLQLLLEVETKHVGQMNPFVVYLKNFITCERTYKEDPALLMLDNYEFHISVAAINVITEHSIVMHTLPPHTSH
jgi:hypothetical protein